LGRGVGFTGGVQKQQVELYDMHSETSVRVDINQRGDDLYEVAVDGKPLGAVKIKFSRGEPVLVGYYPHTRVQSTVIRNDNLLSVFQRGKLYQLKIPNPPWLSKVLNVKDTTNSVLSPMPCKVLRVLVADGDTVHKDQPLVVIESMKMEMVRKPPNTYLLDELLSQLR
jgi:3-methylcrotonyl-CoA carboxylase alpha subunit